MNHRRCCHVAPSFSRVSGYLKLKRHEEKTSPLHSYVMSENRRGAACTIANKGMQYDFLVESYASERVKVLSVWSEFKDEDLSVRPHLTDPRGRSVHEQMVHQCMSEDLWFRNMLGIDVHAPPLPEQKRASEFIKRYAEDSGNRLAILRQTDGAMVGGTDDVLRCGTIESVGDDPPVDAHFHHRGQQMAILRMLGRDLHSNYGPTADTGGLMQNHAPTDHQAAEGRLCANLQAARRTRGCAIVAHDGACQQQHHRRRTVCRSQRSADLQYFCAGLTQELIFRLTRLRGLRVIAVDPSDAPSRHRAAMALHGSVRRSNDAARVTVHLVDTESGSYLSSDSITAPIGDSVSAQDRISKAIVDGLQPDRLHRGVIAWGQKPIDNLAAHNLYLQGRYHLNQRTEEGLVKAVEFFEKAIVEDPQYAEAHSGLSDAYGLLAHYGVLVPRMSGRKPHPAPRRGCC